MVVPAALAAWVWKRPAAAGKPYNELCLTWLRPMGPAPTQCHNHHNTQHPAAPHPRLPWPAICSRRSGRGHVHTQQGGSGHAPRCHITSRDYEVFQKAPPPVGSGRNSCAPRKEREPFPFRTGVVGGFRRSETLQPQGCHGVALQHICSSGMQHVQTFQGR